jgi:solute carrier family 8 (sodium/calcium exchanger)
MLHPTKNEDGEILDFETMDGAIHFICIGWKLFFSIVPPPHYAKGWATFICALCMIGLVTAIVEKVATVFGCVIGLNAGINAITFVALGTSLPDTFASMTAAKQEKYADAAVGNVTGSNSVNVFLGLGLPWVYATLLESSTYGHLPDYKGYYAPANTLGFNVVVFSILAITCLVFLVIRRSVVGGELGGGNPFRTFSAVFLISLWFIYVIMCSL